jgi:hypothetical protein
MSRGLHSYVEAWLERMYFQAHSDFWQLFPCDCMTEGPKLFLDINKKPLSGPKSCPQYFVVWSFPIWPLTLWNQQGESSESYTV